MPIVPATPSPCFAVLMDRMSANPWFGALPLADREALLASAELLRLRPGEMLFRQGDAPGGFYGLLGGPAQDLFIA
jgi:CRP/FNR family cyclic AMP-dependent transcriptional regulator